MKISKTLLRSILVAVSIGATTISATAQTKSPSKTTEIANPKPKKHPKKAAIKPVELPKKKPEKPNYCPPCGRG
jgi:hypothetical protein